MMDKDLKKFIKLAKKLGLISYHHGSWGYYEDSYMVGIRVWNDLNQEDLFKYIKESL